MSMIGAVQSHYHEGSPVVQRDHVGELSFESIKNIIIILLIFCREHLRE